MQKCPICGKNFRNKQAVNAHLKKCKQDNKEIKGSDELVSRNLAGKDFRISVLCTQDVVDILTKINKKLRDKDYNEDSRKVRLYGALYAFEELGKVKEWSAKKQS